MHSLTRLTSQYLSLNFLLDPPARLSYNLNMMNRFEATDQLVNALRVVDGGWSPWSDDYQFSYAFHSVYSGERFLDELNEFPAIMVVPGSERIVHEGDDTRFSILEFQIRAIMYDEVDREAPERLAEDIEHVLSYYRTWSTRIEEMRLYSIVVDSGVNFPLGAAIFSLTVMYYRN